MHYILFIDDERTLDMVDTSAWPVDEDGRLLTVFTARSSAEAVACVEQSGLPAYMSLDFDLGGEDTTMVFLKWLTANVEPAGPMAYGIHSANIIGSKNMKSYIDSWEKSLAL